ncbi:hypothetical protein GEMRC1_013260 [Eukaryota sp. GEM-RC1]
MDSILEQIRSLHEDFEHHEQQAAHEFLEDFHGPRDALLHHCRVAHHLNNLHSIASQLQLLYTDHDQSLSQELHRMGGDDQGLDQAISNLFSDLNSMQSWYAQHPTAFTQETNLLQRRESSLKMKIFYQSSRGRKTLDDTWISNSSTQCSRTWMVISPDLDTKNVDYLAYFDLFYSFKRGDGTPVVSKRDQLYYDYVSSLFDYLFNFIERCRPLFNSKQLMHELRAHFYKSDSQSDMIDFYESAITHLANHHVSTMIEQTRGCVENRQVRSLDELMDDLQSRVVDVNDLQERIKLEGYKEFDEQDMKEEVIYNPKGLPLDFDGKPIPYWLYKLQGLSKKYDCEICGDVVYRGRKRFERHFNQPRHGHALKCLQIPNTKHFKGVAGIADALRLYEKLKQQRVEEVFDPEEEEEVEDIDGNIMNRKTWLLIEKQFG